MDSGEKWYSVKEVSERYGWSPDTIRRQVRQGFLRAIVLPQKSGKRKRQYDSMRIAESVGKDASYQEIDRSGGDSPPLFMERDQMPSFRASTQYGDWHGTARADNIDPSNLSVSRYLREKGLLNDDEFLLAVQLYVGETHHHEKMPKPYIHAFVLEGVGKYEDAKKRLEELEKSGQPIPVREINIDMSLLDFFGMFKRFSVMLTWLDLPLEDREYRVTKEV